METFVSLLADDATVPYELGRRLVEESKPFCDIELITYEADMNIGHDGMYRDPDLPGKLKRFLEKLEKK